MKPLIPQQRLDKNGKLTTRHVHPDAITAAGTNSFPSPAVAPVTPVQTPREAATAAWKRLEGAGMRFSSAVIPNLEYLSEDSELLHAVVDRYVEEAGLSERALWQGMITFTEMYPREELEPEDGKWYLESYRSGLVFFEYVSRLSPYDPSGRTMDYYQREAHHFNLSSEMMPESLDRQDPDAVKAVLLVMRVEELRGAADWDSDAPTGDISDKNADIEFLARNMKRVETVLEGLLEMQATDSEAVETLWNIQASLRDGAL